MQQQEVMPSVMDRETLRARQQIAESLLNAPMPPGDVLRNLGLFLLPMDLKRFLFFDSLYRQFINTPGIVCEFGCRWGQTTAILQSLRAIYEPFNQFRTIIGFDTFEGLKGTCDKDGNASFASEGAYAVTDDYPEYLEQLLTLKEAQSALPHVKKFRIIAGDASETFANYLAEHPETIVSFAYFDMDIYEPTVNCLRLLKNHLTKGSIVGFDELNLPAFPGETAALQEAVGLRNVRLQRNPWCGPESFFVVE